MSRSFRKLPIFGNTTATSEKEFKAAEHRRERRAVGTALRVEAEPNHTKAYGSPWSGPKDGRHFWRRAEPADMRK